MKLNPLAIAQAMKDYAEIKKLIDAMRADGIGQDARWNLLQTFLSENPKWDDLVKQSLKLKPPDALEFIITELGFNPQTLATMFDRDGQLRTKLESGIEIIQTLYKERMSTTNESR
jgi:hypothetical protein